MSGGGGGGKKPGQGESTSGRHQPDARPEEGEQCPEADTSSSTARQEGTVHVAAAPHLLRGHASGGVLQPQAGGRTGHRRGDLAALWRGSRRAPSGSIRTAGQGWVSSESGSAGVCAESRWPTTADRRAGAGRQDRPEGNGGGTEPGV